MTVPPDEMTLDELRAALSPHVAANAAFDGWSEAALAQGASELGVPAARARLAFPGGAVDQIDAWFAHVDRSMAAEFPADRIAAMRVRNRIGALIRYRLDLLSPQREALRRALAILAMPQNVVRAGKLGWRSADAIWRVAGDTAVDFNHYTKRATLAAVYAATLLAFLDDESEGHAETSAFLDRRIGDVMRIEKFKAQLRFDPERHFSPTRFLGRLRYPAR